MGGGGGEGGRSEWGVRVGDEEGELAVMANINDELRRRQGLSSTISVHENVFKKMKIRI